MSPGAAAWLPARVFLARHGIALGALLALTLAASALIVWSAAERYRSFVELQDGVARNATAGTAAAIEARLDGLRQAVHLLAEKDRALLDDLARNPEDDAIHQRLFESVRTHFPEAFATTVADTAGEPLRVDFDGLIDEVCVRDLGTFAQDRAHSRVYLHPNPLRYHFDIMVDRGHDGARSGIFFVSFPAEVLARVLAQGQPPGHELLLLRRDVPGLIEIGAGGARVSLGREFHLSEAEQARIRHRAAVAGTHWELVALPEPGLYSTVYARLRLEAGLMLLAVAALLLTTLLLLYRRHAAAHALAYTYQHDPETGLPNRYLLLEWLQQRLHGKRAFALALLDLGPPRQDKRSFFEQREEDRALRQAGVRLAERLKNTGLLAYLGGREFALLLEGESLQDLTACLEALLEWLNEPAQAESGACFPQAGIGVAQHPRDGRDLETLSQRAATALYTARQRGGGMVIFTHVPVDGHTQG